jgi:hypothetical protein
MPYAIHKSGTEYKVVSKDSGKTMGTHPTEEHAKKQLAALYANVKDACLKFSTLAALCKVADIGYDRTNRRPEPVLTKAKEEREERGTRDLNENDERVIDAFLESNDDIEDYMVHGVADKLGLNVHKVEEYIYARAKGRMPKRAGAAINELMEQLQRVGIASSDDLLAYLISNQSKGSNKD